MQRIGHLSFTLPIFFSLRLFSTASFLALILASFSSFDLEFWDEAACPKTSPPFSSSYLLCLVTFLVFTSSFVDLAFDEIVVSKSSLSTSSSSRRRTFPLAVAGTMSLEAIFLVMSSMSAFSQSSIIPSSS